MKFAFKKYLYLLNDFTNLLLRQEREDNKRKIKKLIMALILAVVLVVILLFVIAYLATKA